ncbi:MAG: aspartate-semialdehyde dehydrogenase [Ignavibacteriae bacterium]|nr:aspartate-semialdehyde dehydrogenase [Ignavibacteriota bacterium]
MKIKAGILGCTGAVGQKLVSLLSAHPDFEITEIAASENSAGKKYVEAVNWKEQTQIPDSVKSMTVKKCEPELDAEILFSGLDSSVAGKIEADFAKAGYIVVSNSKNHRMEEDVPLVIPEVNAEHFNLIDIQKKRWNSGGFIVTNPNCSTIALAISLYPIHKKFGISKVMVTTMQAISGAGYPGVPSLDILGNVIPHIKDEEEKIQTETQKILGNYENGKINFAGIKVSAACNRVPVRDGHTLSVSVELIKKASKEEIIKSFNQIENFGYAFSPEKVIEYTDDPYRPQPLLDGNLDKGMRVTTGNLRKCNILDWKFTALGHNTIRGAAGAAILNAEWLIHNGYTERKKK